MTSIRGYLFTLEQLQLVKLNLLQLDHPGITELKGTEEESTKIHKAERLLFGQELESALFGIDKATQRELYALGLWTNPTGVTPPETEQLVTKLRTYLKTIKVTPFFQSPGDGPKTYIRLTNKV